MVPLKTFKHDADLASPASLALSGGSPSRPTLMKLQQRTTHCVNRVEHDLVAGSPGLDLPSNNMVSPRSEMYTWPYAIDTSSPTGQPKALR